MPDLKVEDIASELQVNPETVKRLLQTGKLEGYKIGSRWRVTREALDAFKRAGGTRPVGRPRKGEGGDNG
jgi:excisionase family DNA binding protein